MSELICSVCLYVSPRPGADRAELELLTIIDGQMVCVRHAPCARGDHHHTILGGVHLESNGEMTSLSAYQDWRARQQVEYLKEDRDG